MLKGLLNQRSTYALASVRCVHAHAKCAHVLKRVRPVWEDIAPADDTTILYRHVLRYILGDGLFYELPHLLQGRRFNLGKVPSFACDSIEALAERLCILDLNSADLDLRHGTPCAA